MLKDLAGAGPQVAGHDTETLLGALNHGLARANFGLADGARGFHVHDAAKLHINELVVGIGEEGWSPHCAGPLCVWIGRRDELRPNIARPPKAASSWVARYSFTAQLAVSGSRVFCHSEPRIERCLLASARIRLASTANPSPPTRLAAMHASTTRSKTRRKMSLSKNRSLRARENAE